MTMSTPSPRTVSSESVTRTATSMRASARRSRPVISQSIQTIRSWERSVFTAVTAVTVRAGTTAHPADGAGRDASLS